MLEVFFEGPASEGRIVVAAGLSFVMPMVFVFCPGRGKFDSSATPSEFDAGFSREFSRRGGGGKEVDCFSGEEFQGDVRKLVSETAACKGTLGFFSIPPRSACFTVVSGLGGEVSKDSMRLVSATEASAGGGILDFIFITLLS